MEPAENTWQQHQPAPPSPQIAAAVAAAAGMLVDSPWRKNPKLSALLSIAPGLGNIYNGLYVRGFIFFLIFASLIGVAAEGHELFGMAAGFFWFFNVIDAYRQATLINYGYAQDLGLLDLPKHPKAAQGGLIAGILLTLIGLVALLEQYFTIDLDWLFDLWPAALMLIGIWLMVGSVRERLKEREREQGL